MRVHGGAWGVHGGAWGVHRGGKGVPTGGTWRPIPPCTPYMHPHATIMHPHAPPCTPDAPRCTPMHPPSTPQAPPMHACHCRGLCVNDLRCHLCSLEVIDKCVFQHRSLPCAPAVMHLVGSCVLCRSSHMPCFVVMPGRVHWQRLPPFAHPGINSCRGCYISHCRRPQVILPTQAGRSMAPIHSHVVGLS